MVTTPAPRYDLLEKSNRSRLRLNNARWRVNYARENILLITRGLRKTTEFLAETPSVGARFAARGRRRVVALAGTHDFPTKFLSAARPPPPYLLVDIKIPSVCLLRVTRTSPD